MISYIQSLAAVLALVGPSAAGDGFVKFDLLKNRETSNNYSQQTLSQGRNESVGMPHQAVASAFNTDISPALLAQCLHWHPATTNAPTIRYRKL